MFRHILFTLLACLLSIAGVPSMAATDAPHVVCEVAVIKTKIANSNAISVTYVAYGGMTAKEVRSLCLGDQKDGGPDGGSDDDSK